uniref:Uncharacterized protein n=1 Tax=Vespula pensylvanica TaxID=30213 RepID=A0A834UFX4_VESPE|nr:hypothetical protein H0235_004142 [Vespula pensylvanica]
MNLRRSSYPLAIFNRIAIETAGICETMHSNAYSIIPRDFDGLQLLYPAILPKRQVQNRGWLPQEGEPSCTDFHGSTRVTTYSLATRELTATLASYSLLSVEPSTLTTDHRDTDHR